MSLQTLHFRFLLSVAMACIIGVAALVHHDHDQLLAQQVVQPVNAAAQAVIETAESATDFGSFLPGSFK